MDIGPDRALGLATHRTTVQAMRIRSLPNDRIERVRVLIKTAA